MAEGTDSTRKRSRSLSDNEQPKDSGEQRKLKRVNTGQGKDLKDTDGASAGESKPASTSEYQFYNLRLRNER